MVPPTQAKFTLTFHKSAPLILALSFSVLAKICEMYYTSFPFRTGKNCAAMAETNRFIKSLKENSQQIFFLFFLSYFTCLLTHTPFRPQIKFTNLSQAGLFTRKKKKNCKSLEGRRELFNAFLRKNKNTIDKRKEFSPTVDGRREWPNL